MMNDFLKKYFGEPIKPKSKEPLKGKVSDSRIVKKYKKRQLILDWVGWRLLFQLLFFFNSIICIGVY